MNELGTEDARLQITNTQSKVCWTTLPHEILGDCSCAVSAWRIPLKVFQRPLVRISAAVKKDGAYAESKFQFSCVL